MIWSWHILWTKGKQMIGKVWWPNMLKDGEGFMLEVFEPILRLWHHNNIESQSSPPGLSHKITHGGSTRWAWSKSNCKISFVWERQPETLMSGFFPMEFQEFTKYHREVASNATIQVARWHQRCFGQHDRGQQSKSADGSLCLLLSIVSAWMSHRH